MKKIILILITLCLSITTLTSCSLIDKVWDKTNQTEDMTDGDNAVVTGLRDKWDNFYDYVVYDHYLKGDIYYFATSSTCYIEEISNNDAGKITQINNGEALESKEVYFQKNQDNYSVYREVGDGTFNKTTSTFDNFYTFELFYWSIIKTIFIQSDIDDYSSQDDYFYCKELECFYGPDKGTFSNVTFEVDEDYRLTKLNFESSFEDSNVSVNITIDYKNIPSFTLPNV